MEAEPVTTLAFGLSNRSYAGLQLPVDLGPLGAPGCFVFTSLEAVLPMPLFRNRPSANVAVRRQYRAVGPRGCGGCVRRKA